MTGPKILSRDFLLSFLAQITFSSSSGKDQLYDYGCLLNIHGSDKLFNFYYAIAKKRRLALNNEEEIS
jgi:hypothetical protein